MGVHDLALEYNLDIQRLRNYAIAYMLNIALLIADFLLGSGALYL
jgi:hypothetical protein